jgi:uncharacterized protein (DUF983 family)
MKVTAEVVKGQCPTCTEHTVLVGIEKGLYRCMNCGTDLEQHINGKISYIPVLTTTPKTKGKFYLHDWDDE